MTAQTEAHAETTAGGAPPATLERPALDARVAAGKAARSRVPRTAHGQFEIPTRDPVALLQAEDAGRVEELVPIRYGRMLASPFAFYRGTAGLMAGDLAELPTSGLDVQLCGDAHLANVGGFASPDRQLVFDLNDFDETFPGPFEWDLKRLATSFELAGRHRGIDAVQRGTIVRNVVASYRRAVRTFAGMGNLAVWYARMDTQVLDAQLRAAGARRQVKNLDRAAAKARHKDSARAIARLTHLVDGEPRFVSEPPLVVPIEELLPNETDRERQFEAIRGLLAAYRRSLQPDRRHLLEQYTFVDLARKVVGVGSVGTRCWIALLLGRDETDPLVLQVKEASPSVLEPYLSQNGGAATNHGRRVVEGQRLMQATSDIFLGWIRNPAGLDGVARDFYVRQLWDWKTSIDLDTILPRGLELYADVCGWTLARAHARSGDRVALASYLGKSDVCDRSIATFAVAYADQAERDYAALKRAASEGRITAREG